MIDLSHLRLAQLGLGVRVGLTVFLAMIVAGYAAGLWFMAHHLAQKDGDPKLEWIDLVGTYHGVDKPAPLLTVLERADHRAYLTTEEERETLVQYVRGGDQGARSGPGDLINDRYDEPVVRDGVEGLAPADVLDMRCTRCHAPGASEGGGIGQRVPLHDLPAVKEVAYRKKLEPLTADILAVSSHTHFLSIPVFSLLVFGLLLLTGWLRFVRHGLFALGLLALACDFAGMWLARSYEECVYLIVGGGAVFGVCLGLAILGITLELWIAPYLRGARQPPPD